MEDCFTEPALSVAECIAMTCLIRQSADQPVAKPAAALPQNISIHQHIYSYTKNFLAFSRLCCMIDIEHLLVVSVKLKVPKMK